MAKVFPTASTPEAETIQSPLFCLVADSSSTADVVDLNAWAGYYVTVTLVGDDGAIAMSPANSVGDYDIDARETVATNSQNDCMARLIEGQSISFVVSPAHPYLVHRTVSESATLTVSRS